MKQYKVSYMSSEEEDDLCHVTIYAYSKKEAEEQAKREYWDIGRIVQVVPQ